MESRRIIRRVTGDLVFDPALYQLVIATGALLDRLLCAHSSPIDSEPGIASVAAGGGQNRLPPPGSV